MDTPVTPPPAPSSSPSPGADMRHEAKKHMAALEAWLAPIFANFPHLPQGGRQFVATVAPWLALIFGILGVLGAAMAAMAMTVAVPVAVIGGVMRGAQWSAFMLINLALGCISAVLNILAFSPMRHHKKTGWNFLFYAVTISAISSIIATLFTYGGLWGLLWSVVGYWLLFEIRGMYGE